MKSRILIIVDPQVDFISGSLATKNGRKAIDLLLAYLCRHAYDMYDGIVVTQDMHPENHCSFKEFGGQFVPHCVKGTSGCEIDFGLHTILYSLSCEELQFMFLDKGIYPDKEEFSVLQNEVSGKILKDIITDNDAEIDVCGIATDYCVYETVKDLHEAFPDTRISVLKDFCAAVDENDTKLADYCEANKNVQMIKSI